MSNNYFDPPIERLNSDSIAWGRFGADILPFWVADMDFKAPTEIIEAIKQRAEHGVFGYGDGYPKLREVFAERMQKLFQWKISADQIRCTAGILPILYFLICRLTKPDQSVLLFTPAYPPFFKLVKESGRSLIEFKLKEQRDNSTLNYSIDFDALAKSINAKTKLLIFCSPHNPVGKVFSKDEIAKLAEFCLERGITIISDEIHSELVLDGQHIPTASISEEVAQSVITLTGPTKTFNLPGLKVSHLIIKNSKLRKEIWESSADTVADVSPISAAAALAAYEKCTYWKEALLAYIKENRDFAEQYIRNKFPKAALTRLDATYLSWIDMSAYKGTKSPYEIALSKGKIACGDGRNFGESYEDYIRISLACPRVMLAEGLRRLGEAF
jgi:cystathionine beta-lyase